MMKKALALFFALLLCWGCAENERSLSFKTPSAQNGDKRYWIDFDPACGLNSGFADPDDCIAYYAAQYGNAHIVGYSTVNGNSGAIAVHENAYRLVSDTDLVFKGSSLCDSPFQSALRSALTQHKLTILALGPLTNIAYFFKCYPDLQDRVEEVIFVGSRRPGQVFVANPDWFIVYELPDLNVDIDPEAVKILVNSGVSIHFVPFEASVQMSITHAELIEVNARLPEELLQDVRNWSYVSRLFFGTEGALPFDLTAVLYALWPQEFSCEPVQSEYKNFQLIAERAEGAAGESYYCLPKNPARLKNLALELLSRPSP